MASSDRLITPYENATKQITAYVEFDFFIINKL